MPARIILSSTIFELEAGPTVATILVLWSGRVITNCRASVVPPRNLHSAVAADELERQNSSRGEIGGSTADDGRLPPAPDRTNAPEDSKISESLQYRVDTNYLLGDRPDAESSVRRSLAVVYPLPEPWNAACMHAKGSGQT